MANSGGEYQVFLNFCGPDTRRGFTNSLYHALKDAGIRVFIDDKELPRGETFSSNLLQAIDDSKLYITIFSPNYASHHWCLRELAKMVENISKPEGDGNKKVILPIFYDVKPDDVKLKTDLYSKAILELEQKMEDQKKKFGTEEVETWRQALKKVDAIQGWELEKYEGDGDLSKSVVEEVVNRLRTRQRNLPEDLVGMDDRIAAINNLLDIDSSDVRLVGIYGMGGIGKTTLAENTFNRLCPHFGKNCSFLANISETAKNHGLVKLRQQLLSDISNSGFRDVAYGEPGINRIGEIICTKKVLIVLDDVDKGSQIQELIRVNSFYPGTRILVTTRDKSVLNIREFNFKYYEMPGLREEDALELFSRHAFNKDSPPQDYYSLSEDIVSTTDGLPLAIKAIGSSLLKQDNKKIWQERLEKLRRIPYKDVLEVLRISYNALEPNQQHIFLDVACFFIYENKTNLIFGWEECEFSPEEAIDVLIKRCMIKVLHNNRFWMHDQFRNLGRAIAKEEGTRLWGTADIICKLNLTEKRRSVQALHFHRPWGDPCIPVIAKEIKRFPHLQFLWVDNVSIQGDFAGCLFELKWLYLSHYGRADDDRAFMPTNLHLENIVVLRTYGYEWTEDAIKSLIKEATKLKVLIIESCRLTHETPTFSEHLVLGELSFLECLSLKKISCSIGKLRWLTYVEFEHCEALEKLPKQIGELKNLQHLSFRHCQSLRGLPDSVSKLLSLTKLDLDNCNKIQELPELPKGLATLRLASTTLQSIPDVSNLTNLVELLLSDNQVCGDRSNITQPCDLPWIGRLFKLRKLELCLLNVRATSIEWGSLSLLEELCLNRLDLQTLKQLPSSLRVLKLGWTQVKQVELDGLPNLEELIIGSCEPVARISITSSLNKLRVVKVMCCPKLVELQFHGVLKLMDGLYIYDNESLERLVCLSEEELGCNELQAPELTGEAPELTGGWRRVYLVSSSLKMLQDLHLYSCHKPQEIQFVSTLEALKYISVIECISLKRLGGLSNLKNLNSLSISSCRTLQVVEGIDKLERLEDLVITSCGSMERIFESSSSKIPKECQIHIFDCGQLLSCGDPGTSITWECYREMILNPQTQAADSTIETTFPEIGDPLLEQQDDGDEDDDDNKDDGREDDDDEDNEDDGRDDDDNDNVHEDHENDDGEDDEVGNVHSSRGSSPVCSEDQDGDDDDDGEEDEDNNSHEVLQSSHGTPPVYSVSDSDENNDVNKDGDNDRDGDGDADEDRIRTRTRKRKRGMMKKLKRSKMMMMATMTMKMTTGATTTGRTMTATRTTMRKRFCSHLAGIHKFIPWTTTKKRRKARGKGESMATTRKRTRTMMKKPNRR